MFEERKIKTLGEYFNVKILFSFLIGIFVGVLFSVPLVERGTLGTDFFARVFEDNVEQTHLPAPKLRQAGNEHGLDAEKARTSGGEGAGQFVVSGENVLVVVDQPAGFSVIMSMVSLGESGWIAVHEETAEGATGNILGARRFNAGQYFGSAIELLRATEGEKAYYTVLHHDDGDGVFDFEIEQPARDVSGNLIAERFTATFSE